MEFLIELWLPILLSSVLVFIVSSIIHMFLPYHRSDFQKLPGEDEVIIALRPFNIPPGDYYVPHAESSAAMKSDAYKEKIQQGPVAFLTVLKSGMPSMTNSLIQWFIYSVVVGIFAAYIGYNALGPTDDYLEVFQFTGTVAFTGYALALFQNSIWFNKKWSTTLKFAFDGLIYALLAAGVFGWLWPVT